jgi:esterase/lipase superfamily enzyme
MSINVYGHYGSPIVVFQTSGGDEREYEGQGMIDALGHHIDSGKVKLFCVNSVNNESWYNKQAHPRHRSWMQAMYDAYVADEVVPFVFDQCRSPGIGIATTGASFGAYHAANTLFKHPYVFRRCLALSGVYDIKKFMDGDYDDNCYFNNPPDYMAGCTDPWKYGHMGIILGTGEWDHCRDENFRLSRILNSKGVKHFLDDRRWSGHEWSNWRDMLPYYVSLL